MPDILRSNPLTQISGNFNQVTVTCATATSVKCPPFPGILTPDQFNQLAKLSTDIVTISPTYQVQEALARQRAVRKTGWSRLQPIDGCHLLETDERRGFAQHQRRAHRRFSGDVPPIPCSPPLACTETWASSESFCSCEDASFKSLTLETHKLATGSRLSWHLSYT
jgi:hypothetical protein